MYNKLSCHFFPCPPSTPPSPFPGGSVLLNSDRTDSSVSIDMDSVHRQQQQLQIIEQQVRSRMGRPVAMQNVGLATYHVLSIFVSFSLPLTPSPPTHSLPSHSLTLLPTLSPSLLHSLTPLPLIHSPPIHSLPYPLSLPHSFTHSLPSHSFTPLPFTHSPTHSPSLTPSLTHSPPTHSLPSHSLTPLPTLPPSLLHSLTPLPLIHSLPLTLYIT